VFFPKSSTLLSSPLLFCKSACNSLGHAHSCRKLWIKLLLGTQWYFVQGFMVSAVLVDLRKEAVLWVNSITIMQM
jgi:hypothetical protein